MTPAKCQYWNRCGKYTELTVKIDRLEERLAAKDRRIRALEEENARLKDAQCGGKANPAMAKLFGSSTPSSLIPIKPNSSEEDRKRVGGRPKGHPGHGRKSVPDGEADEVAELPRPTSCPVSGLPLASWTTRTRTVSVYRFRGTRASTVPAEMFGEGAHVGVLGVDRYSAYNCAWRGRMHYCLEHFKRNVRDLLEAEPDNAEYRKHIPRFLELLASAMTLRNRKRGKDYDEESIAIRDELLAIAGTPVGDGRLKGYFELMLNKRKRFFQWVCNPDVEAENNLAERRLRPLVIARKVCFGPQSEKGLKTRETLMTIIDTLSLRCEDPVAKLSQVLDAIGRNKKANVSELLWRPKPPPANVVKA